MAPRPAAAILAVALGLALWGCGGTTTVAGHDGGADATLADAGGDRSADDARGDGPDGALPDGGADSGPVSVPRFMSETAGGARLLSPNYRLELFVAPVRPVGAASSSGYQLKLGPGALRNAR